MAIKKICIKKKYIYNNQRELITVLNIMNNI